MPAVIHASTNAWREISRVGNDFGSWPLVVVRGSVFSAEVINKDPLRLRLKEFLGFGAGCSYVVLDGVVYSIASRIPLSVAFKGLFRGVPGSRVKREFVVEAGPIIEPISFREPA